MNWLQTITRSLARTWYGAKAAFESVRQTWGERSLMFNTLQDSWLEIDAMTRTELQRVHDELIENSPIVQKIRSLFLQFSVGPSGLICTPNASTMDIVPGIGSPEEKTAVERYNLAKGESWERWWRSPELNSEITGSQLTRVWSGLLFDKGEIFVVLTQDERNIPRTQTIDAHRCQSPNDANLASGNTIVDGKEYTKDGKLVAFWFLKSSPGQKKTYCAKEFDRVEAFDKRGRRAVLHKFKVRRPGQVRGIPEGFSVYNLVRDNMDLHKLEMQAAKLASDIANVETNSNGELTSTATRRARMGISTVDSSNAAVTKNAWADYKVSIGAKNIALKTGDKLDQFMITRPSIATQNYWDLHYTLICMGYNVPKLLVMPYSMQGTVTRADLDICGYGFGQENFEIIAELLREVYEWQTEWAIRFDRSLDGIVPRDYAAVFIRPPRKPNVDVGYNAKAMETELKLGIRTVPDVFAEKQQDFRVKGREIFEWLKFMQDTGKEFGVDATLASSLMISEAAKTADPVDREEKEEPATV